MALGRTKLPAGKQCLLPSPGLELLSKALRWGQQGLGSGAACCGAGELLRVPRSCWGSLLFCGGTGQGKSSSPRVLLDVALPCLLLPSSFFDPSNLERKQELDLCHALGGGTQPLPHPNVAQVPVPARATRPGPAASLGVPGSPSAWLPRPRGLRAALGAAERRSALLQNADLHCCSSAAGTVPCPPAPLRCRAGWCSSPAWLGTLIVMQRMLSAPYGIPWKTAAGLGCFVHEVLLKARGWARNTQPLSVKKEGC